LLTILEPRCAAYDRNRPEHPRASEKKPDAREDECGRIFESRWSPLRPGIFQRELRRPRGFHVR
jgi:hypothetical protein